MKRTICIIILVLSAIYLRAQHGQVHGKVSDGSGNPVGNLIIYIPFTSVHTTTNEFGEYRLNNLQLGDIELVFRHLSYNPVSKHLRLDDKAIIELNVEMADNIVEIDEVVAKADPSSWKLGWAKFQEHVLRDPLGRYCKVKNSSDLYFYFDGEKLRGYAVKPIEIINNYLGYRLVLYLDYFWFKEGNLSLDEQLTDKTFAFSGSSFYIDRMENNWLRKFAWQRNRKLEFRGTLRHFLLSVFYGKLDEQGYIVKKAWYSVDDWQKSEDISPSVAFVRSHEMEKVYFWDAEKKKSRYLHYLPKEEYPILSKLEDLNQVPVRKKLNISDKLLVFYFYNSGDGLDDAKVVYFTTSSDQRNQPRELLIDDQGNYYMIEGGSLIWSYLDNHTNLANALPSDYLPILEK